MTISTGFGDSGKTQNFCGDNKDKYCTQIAAIGIIDELNSELGVVLTFELSKKSRKLIENIQKTLFKVGADLSTPPFTKQKRIEDEDVDFIKNAISYLEEKLPKLTKFVLPGGTPAAAQLHVARTICRRAETEISKDNCNRAINPKLLVYINKLSDLLFLLALWENQEMGFKEHLVGLDEDLTPFLE
ncbi:cob(I)yrinic acid a,c-diamide adenosyltransferase [Candidatus Woesearchaeota archaeon]|nr:cob(I)yrinic acid a,c-diamide adenosyltransferase [Candidatus Woesearchaeota archaeon]MBT7062632.1 cob(I)yrinic acid a,c-diamide adenosyltransferase [Candidatus Woesearchaeota archaeon]MBT7402342.1 cob(I)yrinic acid a,c-diamide adenosyltransferase [Candidatus Woesearchaeota archaeon]